MNQEQIKIIKTSFEKIEPIADQAGMLFYEKLFEIAPELSSLFFNDRTVQAQKLMKTLGVVVHNLENIEDILPNVEKLAIAHVDYGVKPEHYLPVGKALIWTIEKGLGDDCTTEIKEAWLAAYRFLSNFMISVAYNSE